MPAPGKVDRRATRRRLLIEWGEGGLTIVGDGRTHGRCAFWSSRCATGQAARKPGSQRGRSHRDRRGANTEWVEGLVAPDERGFIATGNGADPFTTSCPCIYAVGDIRSGSVKRVASGVGEGSVVVSAIHKLLARDD